MNDSLDSKTTRFLMWFFGCVLFLFGVCIFVYSIKGNELDTTKILFAFSFCLAGVVCVNPAAGHMFVNLYSAFRKGEPIRYLPPPDTVAINAIVQAHKDVVGATKAAPPPDEWYSRLRPVLHQVAQYTSPTYYLDVNYHIVDWNIAFELVFSRITSKLRGKHINWLIAQLENTEDVFAHAKQFSAGSIPLVDLEPLDYMSDNYGSVRMLKVAFQLHDETGGYRGWAVTLMVKEIAWERFEKDLQERLSENKLWSVYAGSYDAVLNHYPDYQELIDKVISVVPNNPCLVIDLGAGTGNVTKSLLENVNVQMVTVVENNDGMLDRFRARRFEEDRVRVVKSSVEHLEGLQSASFDAAVMVNVLYAVDDPLACLQEVNRILKKGGVLGFSTTHNKTILKPLLQDIKSSLERQGIYDQLADDFANLYDANVRLEDIARRHTQDDYLGWVRAAGFELEKQFLSEYQGVVMVVHARKVRDIDV